jgi:hypothetical protein
MGPQLGSDRKHLCYVPGKQFKLLHTIYELGYNTAKWNTGNWDGIHKT